MPPLPIRKLEAAGAISGGSIGGGKVVTGPSADWFVRRRFVDPADAQGLSGLDLSAQRKEGVILLKKPSSRGYFAGSSTSLVAFFVSPCFDRLPP